MTRSSADGALCFRSPSPEATAIAGRCLAACLPREGLLLALEGPLGAGKTAFVKGLAAGLGVDPDRVTSPTFVIASEYATAPERPGLAHVDLYRLEDADALYATGFLDLLEPGRVVAVEWADRLPGVLPDERLSLAIRRGEAGVREMRAWAQGAPAQRSLEGWAADLARHPELEQVAWR